LVRRPELAGCGKSRDGCDPAGGGKFVERQKRGRRSIRIQIDFGPGYRIYFGKDGERLVILVGGGIRKRQQHDIGAALAHWRDYKRRKQESGHAFDS